MRVLTLLIALVWAQTAVAQYWATRDYCEVEEARFHASALAPTTLKALQAEAASIPNPKGRFWRIKMPGGAVSHLWGTYHVNDRLILSLPPQVEAAVRKARVFAPEVDWVYASRRQFEKALTYPGFWREPFSRKRIDGLMRGVAENIRSRLVGIGLERESMDYMTLAALAEILLGDPCNDFTEGVYPVQDSYLQTIAFISGAKIVGMEPPDAFNKTLNAKGNEDLALATINLLGPFFSPGQPKEARATSFAFYLSGQNAADILWERAILADHYGQSQGPALQEQVNGYILDDRNRLFLETIRPELQEGGVFMAVGSWHLPGEAGLVALLRDEGATVTRIVVGNETP